MEKQVKGKCKYCGREYTRGYIIRHLSSCKKRKDRLERETGNRKRGYPGAGVRKMGILKRMVSAKRQACPGWKRETDETIHVSREEFADLVKTCFG